jgi:hypothetical protein
MVRATMAANSRSARRRRSGLSGSHRSACNASPTCDVVGSRGQRDRHPASR